MSFQKIEELEARNKEIVTLIDRAERTGDGDIFALKRELFQNKLDMIDLITIEEKRSGITARELKQIVASKPKAPRYETGIRPLDEKLKGGVEIGTFVQLAGESFVGKTHLTLEILSNVANYSKAVFFNFEMSDSRIIGRLNNLLKTEHQWDNLIIDRDSREISALCNEITLKARDGVKFFVIDSKMKIEVKSKEKEYQQFATITRELAKVVQSNDIILILINQMSEDDIKNNRLAFKGSGDQKYDADIALFYTKNEDGTRSIICNKNRQDEYEFRIEVKLSPDGKTVGVNDPIMVQYEEPKIAMGWKL